MQNLKDFLFFRRVLHAECHNMKYNKLRNIKTQIDGITFDSKLEAKRYCELKLLVKACEISDLKLQHPFPLVESCILNGRKKPGIKYLADFVYTKNGEKIVEDTKSSFIKKDPVYRIKKHLMKVVWDIDIIEIMS